MKKISLLLYTALLLLTSCEKWDLEEASFQEVQTEAFSAGAIPTSGTLSGEISGLLTEDFVTNYGHVWSLTSNPTPTVENNDGQSLFGKNSNGVFISSVNNLSPDTAYNYRAYIIYRGSDPQYGEVKSFTTASLSPILTIDSIVPSPSDDFTVSVFGTIANLPDRLPITSYGITWAANDVPEIEENNIAPNSGIIATQSSFSYNVRATLSDGRTILRPYLLIFDKVYYGQNRSYGLFDVWGRKADFPGEERVGATGFTIGSKCYFGMGNGSASGEDLADFWEYDPLTDIWTQKADFGGKPRSNAVGLALNSKGYIGTGFSFPSYYFDFWEYDPQANSWTRKADFPGGPRAGATGFSINSKAYVGTGIDEQLRYYPDLWEYDPQTNRWSRKADLPGAPREGAAGFSLNGKGHIGIGLDNNFEVRSDFWEYDPILNQWTQQADFPGSPRHEAVSFSISDKGYIGTGGNALDETFTMDFWAYDPQNNAWNQQADFGGGAIRQAVGVSANGKGYVFGGYDNSFSTAEAFWEYTPAQ